MQILPRLTLVADTSRVAVIQRWYGRGIAADLDLEWSTDAYPGDDVEAVCVVEDETGIRDTIKTTLKRHWRNYR